VVGYPGSAAPEPSQHLVTAVNMRFLASLLFLQPLSRARLGNFVINEIPLSNSAIFILRWAARDYPIQLD
jgi:hypothetical protein